MNKLPNLHQQAFKNARRTSLQELPLKNLQQIRVIIGSG
jgi:hypothetical protein